MTTSVEQVLSSTGKGEEQSVAAMERLFAAARPGAVFSEPVTAGGYTVITAREIGLGGGFGFGKGFGVPTVEAGANGAANAIGGGSGAGGGGGSNGRPVAVVIIGSDGVRVEPIVDVSKIALAGIAASTAALALFLKMRRAMKP